MNRFFTIFAAVAALWGGFAAAQDAGNPKSYALTLPIAAAPGAPLQRLQLPARALLAVQTPDFADVRVFNAEGQPVAIALSAPPAQARLQQTAALPAFPILGTPQSTGGVSNLDGLQLRIVEEQGRRVVQLGAASSGAASAASAGAAPQTVLGVLLDARSVTAPLVAIALDADLPLGQPVTLAVQASKDLKNWRPLAETVVFKTQDASASLGSSTLTVEPTDIAGQYLRVTWLNAAGQLAAVVVRSAVLTTSSENLASTRVLSAPVKPSLQSRHLFSFVLPFAAPVAALRLSVQARNTLIPVRVFGRSSSAQPWELLASSVIYRLDGVGGQAGQSGSGKEQVNTAIELPRSAGTREIKIEADTKTPGFSAPPDVQLEFEPTQLVFLASGSAPFSLAVGLRPAASSFLPLQSLLPGYTARQENTLPLAKVALDSAAGAVDERATWVISASADEPNRRSWVLWAVLVLGALALCVMAWVLLKQGKNQPSV